MSRALPAPARPILGIDFGTTNSVVAMRDADGTLRYLRLAADDPVFRTVLCFWAEESRAGRRLAHAAGPRAIAAYLDDPLDSRLILSMKTYLAQKSFTRTDIFGRPFTLERLVALFLAALLGDAAKDAAITAGRPVRFAGDFADDAHGEARLRAAFAEAGFPAIDIALEPEAAGYRFARTLDRPATVLIGDFGGGTSDFSILRFDPAAAHAVTPLGYAGIGLAGDQFDFRILDRVVAPRLGKHDHYTVMGQRLPVPAEYFAGFARWHRLSLMRTPRMLRDIASVAASADQPALLLHLIRLIEDEMGYPLYRAVSEAKAALSSAEETVLRFAHGDFVLEERITRADFEAWIAEDLARMGASIDRALADAGLGAGAIDRVFLTGGTAFVPAVRALFADRFGAARISGGGEFVSVAEGLALIGADRARG
ncbi:MAG: Hsp70 family protein [Rhodospirillales bacterium]|nr:Hsp70 family protein [Rhodospirillales bacterium]